MSAQPAIEEVVRIFGYRKFGFAPVQVLPLVDERISLATIGHPRLTVEVVTQDPTANFYLEIALQGRSTSSVSGNLDLVDIEQYR